MQLLTNKTIERLKYDLVRENLIELDDLLNVEDFAQKNNRNLATELSKQGFISEENLLKFIEHKLHIPFVDLKSYTPDLNCLKYIDASSAKKYNILPLFKIEDVLTVAMSDPLDLFVINSLFKKSDICIEPVICSEMLLSEKIENLYFQNSINHIVYWQDMLIRDNITDDILKEIIFKIFDNAISTNVKSILFDKKNDDEFEVFFDNEIKGYIPQILISRFIFEMKNILKLNTDLHNIPQSSRYEINDYSMIISFFPISSGERISIKIYKPVLNIENTKLITPELKSLLNKPSLIAIENNEEIYYSLLLYLHKNYNILSIENKIKYQIPNISQLEINKNIGLYFDEIVDNIDFQGFNAIFIEKILSKEHIEKLKLLSNEKLVVVNINNFNNSEYFDYIITKE